MKHLAVILLLLASRPCDAQKKHGQAFLDSLLAAVPAMAEDSNKANMLGEIANAYAHIDAQKGLAYAQQELELSEKIGWRKGVGLAHIDFGGNYLNTSAYALAMEHYFKALKIFEEVGDKDRIGASLGNIGLVFLQQRNYPKALEYQLRQLSIVKEQNDTKRLPGVLANIARVYREMKRPAEALKYLHEARQLDERLGNKHRITLTLGSIGNIHFDLKEYNQALAYYHRALRLARELGTRQLVADNLGRIGRVHLSVVKDGLTPNTDSLLPATAADNLARAQAYTEEGIALARELSFTGGIRTMSEVLSEVYARQGRYKDALEAFQRFARLQDSIDNTENTARIYSLEARRELELKEKDLQIARLAVAKKRNERGFFVAGILVLLGLVALLYRGYRSQQHSNELLAKEKKRSDDLLLNILPAEVAEELKERGEANARLYDEVSVLFTDFVNFTRMAEQLSPQSLVEELNECFSVFDAIIERNGLEKIKTIGDAYMAVCGLPNPDAGHARKTVQAAIEIRDFMTGRKKAGSPFDIRIGINSGPVVAGIVGIKKFAYDIWGDTVNTAARIEQSGEAGKVNISGTTYELVKGNFVCTPRGRIVAKNKGEIEMYFVDCMPVVQSARYTEPA